MAFFFKFVLQPLVAVIVGRAALAVMYEFGWFPDLWLARFFMEVPSLLEQEIAIWTIAAVIGVAILGVAHWLHLGGRIAALLPKRRPLSDTKAHNLFAPALQEQIKPYERHRLARPDMPLRDAISYLMNQSAWSKTQKPNASFEAAAEIRKEAIVGDLVIWGRKGISAVIGEEFSDTETPIEKTYWERRTFELTVVMAPDAECSATRAEADGDYPAQTLPGYKDLRVNRRQIETIWPRANEGKDANTEP